ncbi:hypothetical protein B0H15DRAFT_948676 [Mycena belliarum]|uniref:Uncharacterized protein n=1 Tax=Mycena belliarum TaxID=1033014 RepID=A0AAD6U8C5_9AGAR|nr:hypothetical protein B0H15DRAFT_948676 [Mycena belliae]
MRHSLNSSAAESRRGTRPIQRTWSCVGTGTGEPKRVPGTLHLLRRVPLVRRAAHQRHEPATRMPDSALAFLWRLRHFLRDYSPRSSVAACGGIAPRPAAPLPLRPCAGTGSSSVHPRSRSPGAASPRRRPPHRPASVPAPRTYAHQIPVSLYPPVSPSANPARSPRAPRAPNIPNEMHRSQTHGTPHGPSSATAARRARSARAAPERGALRCGLTAARPRPKRTRTRRRPGGRRERACAVKSGLARFRGLLRTTPVSCADHKPATGWTSAAQRRERARVIESGAIAAGPAGLRMAALDAGAMYTNLAQAPDQAAQNE